MTTTFDVVITELRDDRPTKRASVDAENIHEAQGKAVQTLYGKRAFLQRDSGIATGIYGQIFRSLNPINRREATSVTGRVRIDIEGAL